jgi:hypothetical protein
LPVRVCDKACRRIKGKVRTDITRAKVLRIERQERLSALQQIDHQKTKDAEAEQRSRVLGPTLLHVFTDAD